MRSSAVALATHAARVLRRLDLERADGVVLHPQPPLVRVQRLVHLDVLAVGEPHDATRLVAVQDQLAVLALQAEADALGDPEREPRADEDQRPGTPT